MENNDKEKYSKINLNDEEDEIEEKSIFSKTLEIPKLFLEKKKKSRKKDLFSQAIRYNPSEEGLNSLQVDERQIHNLYNKHTKTLSKSYVEIFVGNIFTFFNRLLFTIGIVLLSIGSYNNCFFLGIVTLNLIIGIVQEIKAKKAVDKLSLIKIEEVIVIRDNKHYSIPNDKLVLDDIYILKAGQEVPTDSQIIAGEVEVNESLLTGESLPIKKNKDGYLLAGSYIISGSCKARVDRIGEHNYVAQLQNKARKVKKAKSILLVSLNRIIKWISAIILPIGIASFIKNLAVNNNYIEALEKTCGTLIAMIPSGLFLLISTTLTVSVLALAKKKTMVQDSYSIETLARTNILCLDKTGTITDGKMTLEKVINLSNDNIDEIIGDFLLAFDDKNVTSLALENYYKPVNKYQVIKTLPFSSKKKMSAVEFNKIGTYILGAPEFISKNNKILSTAEEYTKSGYRVLLFAHSNESIQDENNFNDIEEVCLFVLADHIREEAFDTINWFNNNDVEIKIISGDNPLTVSQIAKKVGVKNYDKYISLEGLSNDEVYQIASKYTIFGRVSPEQKAILIRSLKLDGNTVAMTGDGVNDILAMKQANCSIAIASGSEAARNASHLVLMDSNFASMPEVVQEGRKVINNIQMSATLFLMKTIYAILIALFCLVTWTEDPFKPCHFYLLEFAVIGFPSFFLALQPNTNLVKGSFIKNVLLKSIPGGISLWFSVICIIILNRMSFIEDGAMITLSSLALSIVGLIVLLFKCLPFNKYRVVLYVSMILISIIYSIFFATSISELNIPELTLKNWLTLLVVVIISILLYILISLINKKIENKYEKD